MNIYTLLYIKQITSKELLYGTGDYFHYSVITYKGKESEKEWLYVEMNHFAATWNTVNQLYFNF